MTENKMTYGWFAYLIIRRGYNVVMKNDCIVVKDGERSVAEVSRQRYKSLDTMWDGLDKLDQTEQSFIADTCWKLASTPLSERSGNKEESQEIEDE